MGIKCNAQGCPHDYDDCCYGCEEFKTCESACNLKPETCQNSTNDGKNSLEIFKTANIDVINTMAQISLAKKELEDQEKKMKEVLVKAMEEFGVSKFENDVMKITYYAPSTSTTIDSTRLKAEKPEIAKEYSKTSNKKSYVKIEVKAGEK